MRNRGKGLATRDCEIMSREAEALRPIFSNLVRRLKPDDIVDKLYENKLLTQAEYGGLIKDVSQQSDLTGVNRRILMAVSKGPEGSVVKFAGIVKTSQPDLGTEILRGKDRVIFGCSLASYVAILPG